MKLTVAMVALLAVLLTACAEERISTYDDGIVQMIQLQNKYGVDFQETPLKDAIPSLRADLQAFERKIVENDDTKPLLLVVDYRLHALESDRLLLEGFKWGEASTTEPGFGCRKGSERILNSSALRNASATEGFASLVPLQQFVEEYPEKASALNLSQRLIVSLNANYAVIQQEAEKDRRIVQRLCFEDTSNFTRGTPEDVTIVVP
jgi:hypothetical protein